MLRKQRSYAEVYNDLDGEIVNLFRVLRSDRSDELVRNVELTPFSREEFSESYVSSDDPVERARRTLFMSAAGYSTASLNGKKWKTGFRGNVTRTGTTPAHDWAKMPDVLIDVIERLRGVVIENLPALDLLAKYDHPSALHYVDPPYPFSTRNERWAGHCYRHEMTDSDHTEMASALRNLSGAVVVSGYRCDLYDELFAGWGLVQKSTHADSALDRVECLWLSPNISIQLSLIDG